MKFRAAASFCYKENLSSTHFLKLHLELDFGGININAIDLKDGRPYSFDKEESRLEIIPGAFTKD